MKIDFDGKFALICGGSHGIGKSVAELIAKCGATVTLIARNEKYLKLTVERLDRSNNQKHSYIALDLANNILLEKKINNYIEKNPKIDILVNNSSGPMPYSIINCTQESFIKVFRQHMLANHILATKVIPYMKTQRYGRIINILGTSIKEPIQGLGLSSIKASTANWAKILSLELGEFGITVNNILPGPTNTRELRHIIKRLSQEEGISTQEFFKDVVDSIALKRIAEPIEIAKAIVFIASEHASFITGSNFIVDGGYLKCL